MYFLVPGILILLGWTTAAGDSEIIASLPSSDACRKTTERLGAKDDCNCKTLQSSFPS